MIHLPTNQSTDYPTREHISMVPNHPSAASILQLFILIQCPSIPFTYVVRCTHAFEEYSRCHGSSIRNFKRMMNVVFILRSAAQLVSSSKFNAKSIIKIFTYSYYSILLQGSWSWSTTRAKVSFWHCISNYFDAYIHFYYYREIEVVPSKVPSKLRDQILTPFQKPIGFTDDSLYFNIQACSRTAFAPLDCKKNVP